MLKKKERLTKKEFDRVFSIGKRHHSDALQLITAKSEHFHGAVVIPKKVYKHAVDRNSLRRRLYHVLYDFKKNLSQGITYIVIAKQKVTTLDKKQLKDELLSLLSKA